MNVKTKGYTLACISAVTYGTIPLFALPIKHAGYSFDTALFYRFLFSAILIGVYLFAKRAPCAFRERSWGRSPSWE